MDLRHLTLHQLRLFNSLGKHLSYTRAAEELHLSQPAVSIQIKRLEEIAGLQLVEQIGKKIYLTSAGSEMYSTSTEVLNRLTVLTEDMGSMAEGVHGELKISAITGAKYFMPHILGNFLGDYPGVEPTLTITNQSKIVQRLQDNMDDLVIMGAMPENLDLDLEIYPFMENPLVVVAPANHPLVGRKNIPLERIAQERFISREAGSGTRAARKNLFAKHKLEAQTYMELGSSEAIKQAIMAGLGISVLSQHSLKLELSVGLAAVLDVQHFPLVRKWNAVKIRGKTLSKTSERFLELLLGEGETIWKNVKLTNRKKTAKTRNKKTVSTS